MAAQNVCKFNKFGYCRYKDMCRNLHVNESCENSSCDINSCNRRHPRECKYFRKYNRCKFTPCKYNHVMHTPRDSEMGKLQKKYIETAARIKEIEDILNEKNDLDNEIKPCKEKLEAFEIQILSIEQDLLKKEEEIKELKQKNDSDERNSLKKKNILHRIEDIEKLNDEKDMTIKFLGERVVKLELTLEKLNSKE